MNIMVEELVLTLKWYPEVIIAQIRAGRLTTIPFLSIHEGPTQTAG